MGQQVFSIGLGPAYAGQTLRRTLLDDDGAMVVGHKDLATGFTELGGGEYVLNYSNLPDGHVGSIVIHIGAIGGAASFAAATVVGTAAVNPNIVEGGEIDGDTITTVSDKTGYALASTGLDQISGTPGSGTGFREKIMWDVQRRRRAELTKTAFVVKTDAGAVLTTQDVSDDGVTQIMGAPE